MKTENKLKNYFQLENMFKPNRIKSVQVIFVALAIFVFLAALATLVKLLKIDQAQIFPLFSNGIDVMSAYKTNVSLFYAIITLEFTHLVLGALMALFFYRFLKSIDLNNPFQSVMSKNFIAISAKIGMFVFVTDFINRLLLQNMDSVVNNLQKVSLINVEYIILLDLIFVFAIIFSRGIDIKNEIDLVV